MTTEIRRKLVVFTCFLITGVTLIPVVMMVLVAFQSDGESMADMSARAVAAARRWDARVEAEHGADAVWVAVSHGDVIKAILADALGIHLDAFQRITVDPASLSVVRYTPLRPFVMSMNTSAGDLSHLKPPARKRSRSRARTSDATVGGGAGPTL